MENRIPYFSFEKINSDVRDSLDNAFQSVLDSKWYILGERLENFENSFAKYIGVQYAVGVGNGMDALRISLASLNLQSDDEVILPNLTFVATLLAVVHAGAKPVLVDIDPETYTLDLRDLMCRLNDKTRVIIPVHLYGNPCDMRKINHVALEYGLHVIEDYAQAVGSRFDNFPTGSIGTINAASFYPTKSLGALGDGGIITTNDFELAEKCRCLRNYGFQEANHILLGHNSRLDELQAALLSCKMPFLDQWILERKAIAEKYLDCLEDLQGIVLPKYNPGTFPSYHIFPIRIRKRDELRNYLYNLGIETRIHYKTPLHLLETMNSYRDTANNYPASVEVANTELSLPIYPGLTDSKIAFITEKIRAFVRMH